MEVGQGIGGNIFYNSLILQEVELYSGDEVMISFIFQITFR